jgi:ATP-dependent DNA helicase DinG
MSPHTQQSAPLDPSFAEAQIWESPKAWIFTSATLGADPTLSWFTQPCGLTHARILQVKSPFNYAKQAVLLVPKNMVLPSDLKHSEQVSELSAKGDQNFGWQDIDLDHHACVH